MINLLSVCARQQERVQGVFCARKKRIFSAFFAGVLTSLSSSITFAQEYFYIQHKPTGAQFYSCSDTDGTPVSVNTTADRGVCSQWEQVQNGNFFHLKNRSSGKYIRPDESDNGSAISIQPSTWRGSWTQWSYVSTGDGFGYIVNRATGKNIYLAAGSSSIEQQPASWKGDYTRWAFVVAGPDATPTPTPVITATPTPSPTPSPLATATPSPTPSATAIPTAEPTPTSTPTEEPTPVPQITPTSTKIEAESGQFLGGVSTYGDDQASGGSALAYLDNIGNGVRFNSVPLSDSIVVAYASMNTGTISVIVNGEDAGDIEFTSTNGWGIDYTKIGFEVDIQEGSTVEIVNQAGDVAMNIDYVDFNFGQPVNPNPGEPTPRPTADPYACDYDPAADDGEGYSFGMTRTGKIYYRVGSQKVLTIGLGTTSQIDGIPLVGPYWYTDSQGNTSQRWETFLNEPVDLNTTYDLTFTRRIAPDFYCNDSASLRPGEGLTFSEIECRNWGSGPAVEPIHKAAVNIVYEGGNSARLTGGNNSMKPDYALYTTTGSCSSESCLENWPMLTITKPEWLRDAVGLSGELGVQERTITVTQDCGTQLDVTVNQVTYNGQGLYYYAGDESSTSTAGASVPGWSLATATIEQQLPRIPDPMEALPSPINGVQPGSHGYTFDIEGENLTVNLGPGMQFMMAKTEYRDGLGDVIIGDGSNDFEFWCSTNQIQWHLGNLKRASGVQFVGNVPAVCGNTYDYFFRFEKRGSPTDGMPEYRWTYSGLFTTEGSRINPKSRPAVNETSANWMRFRHPHAHDGTTEAIIDSTNNNSLMQDLLRFSMSVSDSGSGVNLNPGMSVIRIEALENGAFANFVPVYNYNSGSCCGESFDYGNAISFEITGTVGNISSQTYTTTLNMIAGKGFDSAYGDPRLTMAGEASTNMVFAATRDKAYRKSENDAIFTQHLTTLESADDVDTFLMGHHVFHGIPIYPPEDNTKITDRHIGTVKIGEFACGDCHDRDGRGFEVIDTPDGPRIAPPTYGVGLLQWIEGAEAGLTWDGDVATVADQVNNALINDHGVDPASLPEEDMRRLVDYTRFLTVPNRKPIDDPDINAGHTIFYQVGCADCHKENQRTRSDAPSMFANLEISPFTDMKLHDVGTGGRFRTAPLWSLGHNIELLQGRGNPLLLMHDGRATSIHGAIQSHAGEANNSTNAYNALSERDKERLIKFIESL